MLWCSDWFLAFFYAVARALLGSCLLIRAKNTYLYNGDFKEHIFFRNMNQSARLGKAYFPLAMDLR